MFWDMKHAPTVFRFWRDLILSDPPDLSGWLGFHHVPPGPPFPEEHHMEKMCMVVWCYTGDLDKAEEVFRPIRAVAPAAIDFCGPIPLPALNAMFDPIYTPGLQWYWNVDFVTDLPDAAIDLHLQHSADRPTFPSTIS